MKKEESIGKRIANARKNAGMTQAEVAERLGVSFQAVSSWERDQTTPDASNVIELAKLLNVSISSLLEERGHSFKTQEKIFEWSAVQLFVSDRMRYRLDVNADLHDPRCLRLSFGVCSSSLFIRPNCME